MLNKSFTFAMHLTRLEIQNLSDWLKLHKDTCIKDLDMSLYWSCSSGIGTSTYVKCQCGEEKDITDYSAW